MIFTKVDIVGEKESSKRLPRFLFKLVRDG
jgi:hypothetical protein